MKENKWELVYRKDTIEHWVFKEHGRTYRVILSYGYSTNGDVFPFGGIYLIINNKKVRHFNRFGELNRFLKRRKVPPFSV
jgi:hypothetical protein